MAKIFDMARGLFKRTPKPEKLEPVQDQAAFQAELDKDREKLEAYVEKMAQRPALPPEPETVKLWPVSDVHAYSFKEEEENAKALEIHAKAVAEAASRGETFTLMGDMVAPPVAGGRQTGADVDNMAASMNRIRSQLGPGPGQDQRRQGNCEFCGKLVYYKAINTVACSKCKRITCGEHQVPRVDHKQAHRRVCPSCFADEVVMALV